jgi:peptidoglycan/xylan/chitin deacetylase (PgdA/CDA1 family)
MKAPGWVPGAIKRPLRAFVAALARNRVRWSGRRVGAALVYHRVSPTDHNSSEILTTHHRDVFEAQLRHVRSHYEVVPASELTDAVARRRRGGRIPVAITFDDDLHSHAELAAPILRGLDLPATFFLCGRSLERPFRFWWEHLEAAAERGMAPADVASAPGWPAEEAAPRTLWDAAQTIQALDRSRREQVDEWLRERAGPDPESAGMRTAEVRTLVEAGMEIGFHTLHHPFLPNLDGAQLASALSDGRARLEELTGSELATFAYPHGGWNERTVAAAREAGLRFAFTLDREPVTPASDPLRLGRMESVSDGGRFGLELALLCATRP